MTTSSRRKKCALNANCFVRDLHTVFCTVLLITISPTKTKVWASSSCFSWAALESLIKWTNFLELWVIISIGFLRSKMSTNVKRVGKQSQWVVEVAPDQTHYEALVFSLQRLFDDNPEKICKTLESFLSLLSKLQKPWK